ncbi:MAG: extracellular solute-binding protein [Alphaproteobacteria bacterium]|nr:extracellular solute-binding protein [Alphaproteobacteria bacterium]
MRASPWLLSMVLAAAIAAPATLARAQSGDVVVYTAADEKLHADVEAKFKIKHPNIAIKVVNLSTGPITEKAIAEKANPQADVIWAVNTIALEQLKAAGALEPYMPKGTKIPAEYLDPDGFYVHHWLTVMVMAVNTKVLEQKNLPIPASWEDLAKPGYKGLVSVAAPTKSGTGLTIFMTLVDAYGWNYLDQLHPSIFQYGSSGGAPGRQAGSGEVAIGLTYDTVVLDQIQKGLPVKLVFPSITPNIMEGGGLLAGSKRAANAKLWLDFIASPDGAAAYKNYVGVATTPGMSNVDIGGVKLWKMQKPMDANEFKRVWASKYEK